MLLTLIYKKNGMSVTGFELNKNVMSAIEYSIAYVFDRKPLVEQPKYFLLFGGVANSFVDHVCDFIDEHTVRGRYITEYPLTFVVISSGDDNSWRDVPSGNARARRLVLKSVDPQSVLSAESVLGFSFDDAIALFAQSKSISDNDQHLLSSWCDALQSHGVIHIRESCGESNRHMDGYDDYIEACGNNAFFPLDDSWSVFGSCENGSRISVAYLQKRSYLLRCAELSDLDVLCELEAECWPEALGMARSILGARIVKNPKGQLVIEEDGSVLAVIYSQRIRDAKKIEQEIFSTVDSLHDAQGDIGQLLAVNVRPDMQHRRLGDQLLELMLQHCELQSDLKMVVGVTRCKDYEKYLTTAPIDNKGNSKRSYQDFIAARDERGVLIDPVLRFHELHGAKVAQVMPGYRAADTINHGYGVLVSYDIRNRVRGKSHSPSKESPEYKSVLNSDVSIRSLVESALQERLPSTDKSKVFESKCPLMEMGLDSGDLLTLSETLTNLFALPFSSTFFFEFNTSEKIVTYIESQISHLSNVVSDKANETRSSSDGIREDRLGDIAIVGVACKLPGGIETSEDLWKFLSSEASAISSLPKNRWRWPDGIDPSNTHEGIDRGGFVQGIDEFDAEFFRISPKESELMDPQQRIMLQLSWQCIEDAGYAASDLAGSRTGVYIGASGSDYQLLLNERLDDVDAYAGLATSMAILPNRISYFYDFVGPSVQVDTACSSSLVAIKRAVDELRAGVCEQALVGGVHMMCHPMNSIAYYKAGMLSPDAQCKTFDESANGYVRSEGAVNMMLKPLANALKDNDRIYGVIKGGAVNHGGKAGGLTVPHPGRQAELITSAQQDAGVMANSISYVEAHGTGTSLGDPIEIEGLTRAFSERRGKDLDYNSCGLGSLKANIGHLEAAAGIAALLKVIVCFKYQCVPPQVNFNTLNKKIDLSETPFFVVDTPLHWGDDTVNSQKSPATPMRVGVSSFGSGGANAHIIVESFSAEKKPVFNEVKPNAIIISAKTPEQLRERVVALTEYIQRHSVSFSSLAYTLQIGRESMPFRCGSVVDSVEQLRDVLLQGLKRGSLENTILESSVFAGAEDLQRELKSWVSGNNVVWDKYWVTVPEKISLPSYPFRRETHWLDEGVYSTVDSASLSNRLHPLIQRNTSSLREQRFSSNFSGTEFFLRDHQVNGRPVLPAVAYLEMAIAALNNSADGVDERFELRDVVFSQAFYVSDRTREIHTRVRLNDDESLNIEIFSDDANHKGQHIVHMRCTAKTHHNTKPSYIDIGRVSATITSQLKAEDFYSALFVMGLQYGPAHQAVSELGLGLAESGDAFVLARFELPTLVKEGFAQFSLHPSILDAALQAIYALDVQDGNADALLSLPYAIDCVEVIRNIPSRGYVFVKIHRGKVRVADRSSVQVLDEQGQLCCSFQKVARKEIKLVSTGVASKVSTLLFEDVWLPRDIPTQERTKPRYTGHYVIVCGGDLDRTAALYAAFNEVSFLSLGTDTESSALSERYASYAREMLAYMQAIFAENRRGHIKIQLLLLDSMDRDVFRGLGKMLRTAELENPRVSAQVLSVDKVSHEALENIIRSEILSHDFDVRIVSGGREVRAFSEVSHTHGNERAINEIQFREGGVYLVTGGIGRIGVAFIEHIIGRVSGCKIIIVGRSRLSGDNQKSFSRLQSSAKLASSYCEYHSLDVSEKVSVEHLVTAVNSDHGNIDGVIHSAGVIRDSFVQRKTESELVEVFKPKVQGLEILDQCTEKQALDFFVAFSSTSGVFGNVAQADYAAANGFVDEYMALRQRAKRGAGISLSLSWPLWEEGGMKVDDATQSRMRKSFGIQPIATSVALSTFDFAMSVNAAATHLTIMSGDSAEIRTYMETAEYSLNATKTMNNSPNEDANRNLPVEHESESVNVAAGTSALRSSAPAQTKTGDLLQEKVQQYLTKLFAKSIKLPANKIRATEALENYGIDSIMVNQLTNILEENFGALSKTLFFEYQTIAELAHYFIDEHKQDVIKKVGIGPAATALAQPDKSITHSTNEVTVNDGALTGNRFGSGEARDGGRSKPGPQDIAIVGLSGRYPEAESVDEFWENLLGSRDCVSEVPAARWDMSRYFDAEKGKPGKSHSKWGGFIKDVDKFDPLFFNISPHEAEKIDPQERLFLECVYHTLEDAGYTRESLAKKFPFKLGNLNSGANIGVFVGVMYEEYQLYAAQSNDYGLLGNISSIANRASYFCDFHGPSMAVDTMCSSSLTAIHLACESIVRGECDAAIAGGVNLTVHPNKYLALSQGLFVSSNGRCMSFGEGGDGYVPGEGVGAVLLKPLDQAVEDSDQIYGVIKGTSVNHGGKNNGYTVPNPNVQAAVIAKSLERAEVNPRAVSYIEAHGTGTALGDPIEISGLAKAFALHTQDTQFCAIGSAKSNIGHCESAAGIAGLTKVLLQMKHKTLVPSLHCDPINEKIQFESTPFVVQQDISAWDKPSVEIDGEVATVYPRIAGLSSFGAGGSNAHIVVQDYDRELDRAALHESVTPAIIVLSAKSNEQLKQLAVQLKAFSEKHADSLDLFSLAYTLQVGRDAMGARLAFEVISTQQLIDKLASYIEGDADDDIFTGDANSHSDVVGIFDSDDDFGRTARAWMEKGKFGKLIELWVKGLPVEWEALYASGVYSGHSPRRISLPGYSFVRQRCWVPEGNFSDKVTAGNAKFLHPLLHKNVSSIFAQKFTSVFDGTENFLADHKVSGKSILPGAAFMEMVRVACAESLELHSDDAWGMTFRDVFFEQAAVVHQNGLVLDVRLNPMVETEFEFSISNTSEEVQFVQGVAYFEDDLPEDTVVTIEHYESQCDKIIDHETLYSMFANIGLGYGPSHQLINQVKTGERGSGERFAVATLELPERIENDVMMKGVHPGLLDGALQVCLCFFDLDRNPVPLLPFAIEHIQFFKPVSASSVVIVTTPDNKDALTQSFDVKILDSAGHVALVIQGFSLRKNVGDAASDANSLVGDLTLSPVWERYTPEFVPAWPGGSESVLLVGGDDAQITALTKAFPAMACLPLGADLSESRLRDQIRSQFSEDLALNHIFFCMPASDLAHNDAGIVDAQQCGIFAAFRLIKVLLSLGYDAKPLGFTVLTRDTITMSQASMTCPVHSAIFGFLGSVVKEYTQWKIRSVDCHGVAFPDVDRLLTLPAGLNTKELIFSQGQFYQQRLLPCSITDGARQDDAVVYREGGCYVVVGGAGGLGEVFSEHIIKTYKAQVVWLGRREIDADIEAKCLRLSEYGPTPVYMSVDAADVIEMQKSARDIRSKFGTIHGVVHSALVLNDKGLASMEEDVFASSLVAKIDVSVSLFNAFDDDDLDFMLFFSSLQSLYRPAGQSNYAAGCAFVDAYAVSLDTIKSYAVKTINWGYWGSIGIVASEDYRQRMANVGLGSVEAPEGLAVIERVLTSRVSQVAYLKTTKVNVAEDLAVDLSAHLNHLDVKYQPLSETSTNRKFPVDKRVLETVVERLDALLAKLLFCQLDTIGVFTSNFTAADSPVNVLKSWVAESELEPLYLDWLIEAIASLGRHQFLAVDSKLVGDNGAVGGVVNAPNSEAAWAEWEAFNAEILSADPESVLVTIQAQVRLVDTTLRALPDILLGRKPATHIIFPEASVTLVEGVYKNNHLADYFNDVLADNLVLGIENILTQDPQRKIKILEVGAGTGGTSALLFDRLSEYQKVISEYAYTDISKAFLMHAEDNFRGVAPYLETKLFDVTRPLTDQDVVVGDYDFVIATNVLHATPDIGVTLRNSKALLAAGGVLLVNELSHNSVFLNLTFGLLSGWWLSRDANQRITGSPLLTPGGWKKSLYQEGFDGVEFPAESLHQLGQQIVMAKSNGVAVVEGGRDVSRSVPAVSELKKDVPRQKGQHAKSQHQKTALQDRAETQSQSRNSLVNESVTASASIKAAVVDASIDVQARFEIFLKNLVADTLKMSAAQLDVNESFESYGVDSILVVRLTNALRESIGDISATLLFEVTNLGELVKYFIDDRYDRVTELVGNKVSKNTGEVELPETQNNQRTQIASAKTTRFNNFRASGSRSRLNTSNSSEQVSSAITPVEDVAIVGISGRFPQADTVDQFWENLCEGKNSISEVPPFRWDWREGYSEKKGEIDKIYTKWGGFIEDVDAFDPLFFNISPREATAMDPQERLFLQCAYESIEDSGYTAADLSVNKRVGVFVGVMNNTYQQQPTHWSIANRVSYFLDFNGPSLAIDTACSSSLTALILASEKIRDGSCDACIAGGVNLIIDSSHYRGLSNMTMLSETDECASFGASADGFVDGEGVGAVLLKPLSQALKEGAHIYGIVKGGAINHGGKTNGYTVPNPKSQAGAISEALNSAGVHPREVSYIEAHGTGTTLGDPIEVSGLSLAFSKQTNEKQFCALGSVKSNIGHSESAAGIAALAKVILQMKHKKIVPSLHSQNLNPNIEFANTPFKVQQSLEKWERPSFTLNERRISDGPRIAGISSFGAGGANAHVVVQEFVAEERETKHRAGPSVIVVSAKSETQVSEYMAALLAGLDDFEGDLEDLAYTLQVGRAAFEVRAGLIVNSASELKRKLTEYLESRASSSDVLLADTRDHKESLSVFSSDEDFNATLKSWFEREKYEKILEVWTKGVTVDWKSLYAGIQPKRISLPLYPFEKNRYWKTDRTANLATATSATNARHESEDKHIPYAFVPVLHPLVHTNTSTLAQQKFSTRFSGEEFFLADHIIQGRKTVPSAVILELARVASGYALCDQGDDAELLGIGLSDVVFIQPLWAADRGVEIDIHLTPISDGDLVFEICTFNNEEERVHAKGVARMTDEASGLRRIDLDELRDVCAVNTSVDALYELFASFGIEFGERHRPISSLVYANSEQQKLVIAELVLDASLQSEADVFTLHPSLLDGAFQSSIALLFSDDEHDQVMRPQPFQLTQLDVFVHLPENCVVVATQSEQTHSSNDLSVDIFICDRDGQVCAEMSGFRSRLSSPPSNTRRSDSFPRDSHTNDIPVSAVSPLENVGDLILASGWEAFQPEYIASGAQSAAVLVLGGNDTQRSLLSEYFPNTVFLEKLKHFGKEPLHVSEIEDALRNASRFDHIAVIAPQPNASDPSCEYVREAQNTGVFALYRLVKALLALKYDRSDLSLTVITQQARSLSREDLGYAEHSSVHGFAGAIIKEIPQWHLRLVDLPLNDVWPVSQIFTMPRNTHGRPSIYRLGEWYQQILRHVHLDEAARPAFRKNGVYLILGGAGGAGAAFSQYLIAEYQAQVIWLGRRKENDDIKEKCDALERFGVRPYYISVDATNKAELQKSSRDVASKFGTVNGIVHSALVMSGASLHDMDETRFSGGLGAKLDASVCVNDVFAHDALDFSLFFSSIQAFDIEPKQSNYSAGTSFTDGFVESLNSRVSYPVKVVNWGYIAGTEFVSMLSFQQWMEKEGFGAVDILESMPVIERILTSPVTQCVLHKTTKSSAAASLPIATDAWVQAQTNKAEFTLAHLPVRSSLLLPLSPEGYEKQVAQFDEVLAGLLTVVFSEMALFATTTAIPGSSKSVIDLQAWKAKVNFPSYLSPWLEKSLQAISHHGFLSHDEGAWVLESASIDREEIIAKWTTCKESLSKSAAFKAQSVLIDAVFPQIEDVLRGKKIAPQVLFPSSSLVLVEGIYKNNKVSDYFNEVVAESLIVAMESRLHASPSAQFKILEVGAGTGGTSQLLFDRLSSYQENIVEYCYTDVSSTFLKHANEKFLADAPYLKTQILDIESDIDSALIGEYDFVVASNVLHATSDIIQTLNHVKLLLKDGGILLLNELVENSLFLHLSFGLLEGWWLSKDLSRRISGSPLIPASQWQQAFAQCGFYRAIQPAQDAQSLRHQIFVAQSDGLRLSQSTGKNNASTPVLSKVRRDREVYETVSVGTTPVVEIIESALPEAIVEDDSMLSSGQGVELAPERNLIHASDVEGVIIQHLKEGLMLVDHTIDKNRSFADYGVDSVTGIRLVEEINASLGTDLSPTSIFDYSSVNKLVSHIKTFAPKKASTLQEPRTGESIAVARPSSTDAEQSQSRGIKKSHNDIRGIVLEIIGESLDIDSGKIRSDDAFADYGVDSVTGIRIVERLNDALAIQLSPTSLFDYSSVNKLVAYINDNHNSSEVVNRTVPKSNTSRAPVKENNLNDGSVNKQRTLPITKGRTISRSPKSYMVEHKSSSVKSETSSLNRVTEKGTEDSNDNAAEMKSKPVSDERQAQYSSSERGTSKDPIAIIGMSGRFATADNVNDFWGHLVKGDDLTERVTRWDLSKIDGSDTDTFCDRGGFLNDIDCFDSLFFNISGIEAAYIDPQQRLFLEESWKALEDAGYAGESIEGRRCGVFAGCNGSDYGDLFIGEKSPAQALWGNAASLLSARIAYYLDFKGPAITVDTACSSSLSAIHMACQSIRTGETELALAGGVFVQSTAKFYEMANRAAMLSADGKCHTFDEQANGFVPGEGVGVLMLKKLSEAQRDGDHIYGVVLGSGTNQDGTTNGITAPSAVSQERLITDIYEKYDISPNTIHSVEAHGTGTKLGDPIEFEALSRAFKSVAVKRNENMPLGRCALGAVKTNIGHTTAASGVAGVIKLLMSFKNKEIAPSINFSNPNRHIRLDESPFFIPSSRQAWPEPAKRYPRAAISSFGLSGTNVHAVLEAAPEQYVGASREAKSVQEQSCIVVLSAISKPRLEKHIKQLIHFCREESPKCIDVSYTLATGRKHFPYRFACVAHDVRELIVSLNAWLQGEPLNRVFSSEESLSDSLLVTEDMFSEAMSRCEVGGKSSSYENDLALVARGFCQGLTPKFLPLYQKGSFHKLSLPGTVFEKKRHWVPEASPHLTAIDEIEENTSVEKNTIEKDALVSEGADYENLFDRLMNDDMSIDDVLDVI